MSFKTGQICTVSRKDWKLYDLKTKKVENAQINNGFSGDDLPVVGDFVDYEIDEWGNCFIKSIKKRKNMLKRFTKSVDKNIASNIDVVFIVSSLNKDFELEKMERFCLIASVKNAKIVFVLTKKDLCLDTSIYTKKLEKQFPKIPIVLLNALDIDDVKSLYTYWDKNQTAIFLGSSGVGKSTLINSLMQKEVAKTFDIREVDDKGRHTTTSRDMYFLADGRIIIDTPGIRSIQGSNEKDVEDIFDKISNYSLQCKYSNCCHKSEDGCAVLQAIKDGVISKEEFLEYENLQKSKQKQTQKGILEEKRQSNLIRKKRIESKHKKIIKK